MRKTVNVQQAKAHFSRLVAEVEAGGEVMIARAGKPVAKLMPIVRGRKRSIRRNIAGALKGKIKIAPDFDEPLTDDILVAFQGD
jgi:prevent-host-death family protein